MYVHTSYGSTVVTAGLRCPESAFSQLIVEGSPLDVTSPLSLSPKTVFLGPLLPNFPLQLAALRRDPVTNNSKARAGEPPDTLSSLPIYEAPACYG